ncbi:MAG: hypothetical protein HC763_06205 [Hydrococcus sp. CRU_1_1]|nr:hypothetical protein [Hydrococcus sp. CRU_1_1]
MIKAPPGEPKFLEPSRTPLTVSTASKRFGHCDRVIPPVVQPVLTGEYPESVYPSELPWKH